MSLSSLLASGECGVRWQPDGAELLGDKPRSAFWRGADGVVFQATLSPIPYGLEEAVLTADLEAAARAEFVAHWRATPEEERSPARTDDAGWSPIVEVAAVTVGGAAAVSLIRRLSYAPGDELVVGQLIVPLAKGHLELVVVAKAGMTGLRESMILVSEEIGPDQPMPPQAHYDRRDVDAMFPDHPLSLVRRHLDALPAAVEVTQPAATRAPGEVVLANADSAIVPPPRFEPVPPGVLPLSPTLSMFARPAFGDWVRTFEVWRLSAKATTADSLEQLASKTIAGWADEGVEKIRPTMRILDEDAGRLRLEQEVRFASNGVEKHSLFRWLADTDGAVFRIGASGDAPLPFEQLRAELAAALPTWRRLSTVTPAPTKKPWWKLW